jgi:hypothetical protein
MAWRAIDFQGIISLDSTIVEQLQAYLAEKEALLSQGIAEAFPSAEEQLRNNLPKKLAEGIDLFARAIAQQSSSPSISWQPMVDHVEHALWDYLESLESTAVELFQQLSQISLEQWRPQVMDTVTAIKELLAYRMEELKWVLKRVESLLSDYRKGYDQHHSHSAWWLERLRFWETILDGDLAKNLEKSHKFLIFNYQKFLQSYDQYESINRDIEHASKKFDSYPIFKGLEAEQQQQFKKLYRLLKLHDANSQTKALPAEEVISELRMAMSPNYAFSLFKEYFKILKLTLIAHSRQLKTPDFADPAMREILKGQVSGEIMEVRTLGATIEKYRNFLLHTDPDPYVRATGGFSEWIVGQEPAAAKALLNQEYNIDMLDSWYRQMESDLALPPLSKEKQLPLQQEIAKNLHSMGQPLASQAMMAVRAEKFVSQLQQLHEMSSQDPQIVDYVTQILSRAMRTDWKYHTLHALSQFHELYVLHHGIVGSVDDRQHANRWNQFNTLTYQIHRWIKERKIVVHLHDIEVYMNDIKGYLQDFLAHAQRTAKDSTLSPEQRRKVLMEVTLQLLEYRYLFGQFFYTLREQDGDEALIRHRFLFVDQYFESVENILAEK